jgi:DNA recombination protein RmuC
VIVIALIGGVLVGALLGWALTQRRGANAVTEVATLRVRLQQATENLDAARNEVTSLEARVALETDRLREEHRAALANLEVTFKSVSAEVLEKTVSDFASNQEELAKQRDHTLNATLSPIREELKSYQEKLGDFDVKHREALDEVKNRASGLLEAQLATQASTTKLNQLLGRSDQRGHWGEIQLANIMEKSGLRPTIDYQLQSSNTNDDGNRKRPDCVVDLTNGTHIVIDAKFPFDAFEKSLDEEDPEERRRLKAEHARALRSHVKTLKSKSYWSEMEQTPAFTVCFLPSDAALAAAFESDAELHAYAIGENVLIVGPTNLLALLWSAGMVLRQHTQVLSARQILFEAGRLYERVDKVASHLTKLGRSLESTVVNFNNVLASSETNMMSTARKLHRMGVAPALQPLAEVPAIEKVVRRTNQERWGVEGFDDELEARAELLDIEVVADVDDDSSIE